jgi:hypothetical protein
VRWAPWRAARRWFLIGVSAALLTGASAGCGRGEAASLTGAAPPSPSFWDRAGALLATPMSACLISPYLGCVVTGSTPGDWARAIAGR